MSCQQRSRPRDLSRTELHRTSLDLRSVVLADAELSRAGGLRSVPWLDRYSSSREDLVGTFFAPALRCSTRYDRAAGYFRSSIYSLLGDAVATFVGRGGKMRLLCSPELATNDIAAIERGLDAREVIDRASQRELERILQHPMGLAPVEMLANLIAADILEIRIAVTLAGRGVFHDKIGVFSDGSALISFSGSINETWRAWHPLGNHESFEAFKSWDADSARVDAHKTYFESLWSGGEEGLQVFEAPTAFKQDLLRHANDEPRRAIDAQAQVPTQRRLFDHQQLALADWVARGRRGLLKHATGSGKTLTALHGLRDWIADGKAALVLVPSTLLLEQWKSEAQQELGVLSPSILLAGGGHEEWRRDGLLRLHTTTTGGPRIVIATMQTAATDAFQDALAVNPRLLLIADEAHRLGSAYLRRGMLAGASARLGLSATPERAGDPDGTAALFDYFGGLLDPIFTLQDAIAAKRLVPYVYNALTVGLSSDEMDDWITRTERIRKVFAQERDESGNAETSPYLKQLLIQRARIAKQASAKVPIACDVVKHSFRDGQHWLIYCSDQSQLQLMMGGLRHRGMRPLEYHSAMQGDRAATLDHFRRLGGPLVSIRCLDEGVDIPEVSHAVILASSRNAREFVQRRGRVLRVSAGKREAHIWDLLVVPRAAGRGDEFDGLVYGEVVRAAEFAGGALNAGAELALQRLCIELGIDLDDVRGVGLEDDDETESDDV